jgi:RNA-binding protein
MDDRVYITVRKGVSMSGLEGYQRKYLRGIAHGLKPVVLIGQKGLTAEVLRSAETALDDHELIKVKFNEFKEKDQKEEIIGRLERETGCERVGLIGHTAIFYRQQKNPEKRKISLPGKKPAS